MDVNESISLNETCMDLGCTKIYSIANPYLHSFSLCLYIKSGLMYESKDEKGVTHLFEHMVFRNLKNKYSEDFYRLLIKHKLTFNACTYKEFVQFEINGLPSGFGFAADVICHIFDDICVSKTEYCSEVKRVKAEMRENSEKTTIGYFADKIAWNNTPLCEIISGSCGVLDKLSQRKMNEFKNKIFSSHNYFFYVTGNITEQQVNQLSDSIIKRVNIGNKECLNRYNTAAVPADFSNRKLEINVKNSRYYIVRISFDADNEKCPLNVQNLLYSVLFEGDDSLVFKELSEDNPYVYSFDSTHEQYNNISMIKLEFEVSKRHLYDAVEKLCELFFSIKRGEFSLENAVNKQIMRQKTLLDSPSELNLHVAYENHILRNKQAFFNDYTTVKKEALISGAKEIFSVKNLVFALKGEKKSIDEQKLKNSLKKLDKIM